MGWRWMPAPPLTPWEIPQDLNSPQVSWMPSPSFCPSHPSMQGRPSSSCADPQHPIPRTQHNTPSPATALDAIKEPGGCHPDPSCSQIPPCPRLTSRLGAGKGLGDTEPAEPGGNSTDPPPHLYSSTCYSRNKHLSCPSPALAHRTGTCWDPYRESCN